MLIVTLLLLTKFESTNLMSLNDKWTFGVRTLWIDYHKINTQRREGRQRTRRTYVDPPEEVPYANEFQPNAYFISRRLGKTFNLGIQADGEFGHDDLARTYTGVLSDYSGSSHRCDLNGTIGVSLTKYFCAGKLFSPFVDVTPNFAVSVNQYYDVYLNYAINLDAGVEHFFNVWGKNLSIQLKTPLVKAMQTYYKVYYFSPYDSNNNVYFYSPLEGNLTSYLCLHF